MDAETRAAFARIDHWFELSQAQHLELRQQMDSQHQDLRQEIGDLGQQVGSLRQQISRVEASLDALWAEFRTFRDWVTAQFAELRDAATNRSGRTVKAPPE